MTIDTAEFNFSSAANYNEKSHRPDEDVLEPRIVVQPDREHSNIRQEAHRTPHYLFPRDEKLTVCIKTSVIDLVIVSLSQHRNGLILLRMHIHRPMHDWDVSTFDLENYNISRNNRILIEHGQE